MAQIFQDDDFGGEFAAKAQVRSDYEALRQSFIASGRNSVLTNPEPIAKRTPRPKPPVGEGPTQPQPADDESDITFGGVVREVGVGIVETPGAAISGAFEGLVDARIGLLDASEGLRDWFVSRGVISERVGDEAAAIAEKRKRFEALVVNDERSIIGNVVHDIANFMVFFIPGVRGVRKLKSVQALSRVSSFSGRVAVNAVAGSAAEFAMTDTAQESFLDILRGNPELTDHGMAFLNASDMDVPRLERRLENALVGLGFGVVADGALQVFKVMRAGHIARRTAKETARKEAARAIKEGFSKTERAAAIESETARIKKEFPDLSDEEIAKQARRSAKDLEQKLKDQAILDESVPKVEEAEVQIGTLGPKDARVSRGSLGARRLADASREIREKFPELTPQQARAEAEAATTTVEVNVGRISTEEDVKQLIQDVTDLFPEAVDRARRGVRTNVQTSARAQRLQVGMDEVLATPRGTALGAEQAVAYRLVWTSLAETVEELAQKAANKATATAVDMFKYRKAMAAFHAVNDVMLGVRAEAGRALQSWRITVGGSAERAQQLSALLESGGGDRISRSMAETYLKGIRAGMTPGQINRMVRGMAIPRGQRFLRAIQESYVMGLLWVPTTHMANLFTNTIFPLIITGERAMAEQISKLAGRAPGDGVAVGEALARVKGAVAGIRSALHLTAISDDMTRKQFEATSAASSSKLDGARVGISSEAAGINVADETGIQLGLGKAIDYWGAFGRTPGVVLGGADDIYKVTSFAMEREALALRQATGEAAEKGWGQKRTLERVGELLNDPPEHIRLESGNAATYATFQSDVGKVARMLMNARNAIPGLFVVLPFIKTPAALLNRSFERTPFAPLVGTWRADIRAGGARRDIAIARMASGTAITLMFADWAYEDRINAAFPLELGRRRAQQRVREQPDSLKIGDWTLQLNRIDPFGMQVSLAGNTQQLIEEFMLDEEDLPGLTDIMAAIAISASQSTTSKSWLQGIAQVTSAMQHPERRAQSVLQNIAKTLLLPHASLFRTVETAVDPTLSDVNSIYDAVASQILGLASRLPRRRNLWGEPIRISRINLITPIKVEHRVSNPVDEAILAERGDVRDIPKSANFDGVPVNFRQFPRVYETYVTLAGNELRHPATGKGAKDFLNGFVKTSRYLVWSKGPEGQRIKRIREWVNDYRRLAQLEILRDPRRKYQTEEFDEFREFIKKQQADALQLLRPLGASEQ